jgi:hypothetical protein
MWMISVGLLVSGLICVVLAVRGETLGSVISASCQASPASRCGVPNMPVLISGERSSDLALWSTAPAGEPGMSGVWGRLVDARSGTAQGPQVRVSGSQAQQGVLGVYNPASRRYLVLWQSGDEISGQLLNDRLQVAGAGFQIPAHDYYVRPGELATDPDGGFLFSQAQNPPGGLESQTQVFVTRISAAGRSIQTASWLVSNDSRPFQFAEAHAVYVPTSRTYLVAWSLFGTTGSALADRIVGDSAKPLSEVHAVAGGADAGGADFALGYQPQTATTRVIWLTHSTSGAPTLSSVRLSSSGAPVGPAQSIGQVSPIPAEEPAGLGGLTPAPAGIKEIANWQGLDTIDTFTIPATGAAPVSVTRTPLGGVRGSYAHASATNTAAQTVAVLDTSNQGNLSQLYAHVTSLPN